MCRLKVLHALGVTNSDIVVIESLASPFWMISPRCPLGSGRRRLTSVKIKGKPAVCNTTWIWLLWVPRVVTQPAVPDSNWLGRDYSSAFSQHVPSYRQDVSAAWWMINPPSITWSSGPHYRDLARTMFLDPLLCDKGRPWLWHLTSRRHTYSFNV